jgi:hypothetical protein
LQDLLQSTAVPRPALDKITNIRRSVFDVADRMADDVRAGLKTIDWLAVLQPIVVEYCITL